MTKHTEFNPHIPTYEELVETLATITSALGKRGCVKKGDKPLLDWAERVVVSGRVAVAAVRSSPRFHPTRAMISRNLPTEDAA